MMTWLRMDAGGRGRFKAVMSCAVALAVSRSVHEAFRDPAYRFKDALLLCGWQGGVEREDLDGPHLCTRTETQRASVQKHTEQAYGNAVSKLEDLPATPACSPIITCGARTTSASTGSVTAIQDAGGSPGVDRGCWFHIPLHMLWLWWVMGHLVEVKACTGSSCAPTTDQQVPLRQHMVHGLSSCCRVSKRAHQGPGTGLIHCAVAHHRSCWCSRERCGHRQALGEQSCAARATLCCQP